MINKQENWGFNVGEERQGMLGFEGLPEYVYLIYIRFDRDSCLFVRHYWSKIESDQSISDVEEILIKEARPGFVWPCESKLIGANFEEIVWTKKCYFTIFLDEKDWDFYSYPNDDEHPIVFVKHKSYIENGRVILGPQKDKNFSFFDAVKFKIFGRNAIRCINYKKCDEAGTDNNDHTTQMLAFEIYLMAPFAEKAVNSSHITIVIDPPGNNGGPPK